MVDIFNPHLIIIKQDEGILGIHDIKYDYTSMDYYIIITDSGGVELFKGELTSDTFIELEHSIGIVNISYYYKESNKLFYEEELDMQNLEGQVSNKAKASNNKLIEKVRYEMDNPKGTTDEVGFHTLMLKKSAYDKDARSYIENKIRQVLVREKNLTDLEIEELVFQVYSKFYGMGVLQALDDNSDISEIMVNAYTYPKFRCDIHYKKTNQPKKRYDNTFDNLNDLLNVFSRAISFSRKELNNMEDAIVEATRANGDRVNIIIPEASESYILNIRKFTNFTPTKENMLEAGTINEEIDVLMDALVKGKANIGIGGEMGTGKTSFINYLLTYTDPIERKAVIATVREIDIERTLKGHDIIVLNVDESKGFTFGQLLRTSLRTTADRVIVPESRGDEFKQVYEANLKTKGNIFTAHATTDEEFLDVCTDMYMGDTLGDATFIKNKISKSIDFVIIMAVVEDRIRIKSISEVVLDENNQYEELNLLYYWDFGDGENRNLGYKRTGNRISERTKRKLFIEGVSSQVLKGL